MNKTLTRNRKWKFLVQKMKLPWRVSVGYRVSPLFVFPHICLDQVIVLVVHFKSLFVCLFIKRAATQIVYFGPMMKSELETYRGERRGSWEWNWKARRHDGQKLERKSNKVWGVWSGMEKIMGFMAYEESGGRGKSVWNHWAKHFCLVCHLKKHWGTQDP